ncbi:NPCBM/NEW2 domain-containing protein [Sphaerisporangium aureirubrum]|uniref:NPCBM/NEW2 domain-containing protein n=1 Tax=Sphaerisporangium aureirubrum TaxID=1544736 RepID=A0ABW1NW46_9ACTN
MTGPREVAGPAPPAPDDGEGEERRRHERWNTLITATTSILATLITTAGAIFVAVWAAPDKVGDFAKDALGEHVVVTSTVTVGSTVTTTTTAPAPAGATPTYTGGTGGPLTALTTSDSVANDGCWFDDSIALAGSDRKLAAVMCNIAGSGAVVNDIDYTVPENATRFMATVGTNRQSPNASARVEFSVLDLTGRVLDKKTVTYATSATIEAAVSGVPRVKLQIALVDSDDRLGPGNMATVGWITPAFS